MPAIQLAQLRIKSARLADLFSQPAHFIGELHNCLNFYADYTHRAGQAGVPAPLLPSYNTPIPVLRQIFMDVTPLASQDMVKGLVLCDALWAQENLECRKLAAWLVGTLPVDQAGPLLERVHAWALTNEPVLHDALVRSGLTRFRRERGAEYIKLVARWISDSALLSKRLGLMALKPLLEDASFENFPVIHNILSPLVWSAPSDLRPDLVAVCRLLLRRSERETAFFLRHNLISLEAAWVARQLLQEFSPEIQDTLRAALKARRFDDR